MNQIHFPIDGVSYPTNTDANLAYEQGCWMRMTVGNLVRNQAKSLSDKIFIISDHLTVSYVQFDMQTEILAASLIELGLQPGDRAIFQMGTVPETLIALFACYKAGIIPVCTLPQHREFEISSMIHLTKAKVYFVQADFNFKFDLVNFARIMKKNNECIRHIIVARGCKLNHDVHSLERLISQKNIDKARAQLFDIAISSADVLTFQLSGGSTGTPKIIPRFHGEYLGQAHSIVKRYKFTEFDIAIWPLPLIHNAAMLLAVLPILLSGGTIVLQQRFELQAFLSAIKQYGISFAGSIGPIAESLLDYKDFDSSNLHSLRMFFTLDRADAIENHLKVPTTNLYGITEGLLMTCALTDLPVIRFKTMGYPTCPLDQIKVLDLETEQESTEGELCFRGPYTLRGYYNAPEINKTSFTNDGFFRSGDLVRKEIYSGQIVYTFLGRLKDNISRGGEKFSAEEVERIIVLHPAITDAKVVAMPDQYLGEKACVFLIIRSGQQCPTLDDLGAFLGNHGLARYKHPERIETIEAFPLTKVGKVDKKAMRQLASAMLLTNAQLNTAVVDL